MKKISLGLLSLAIFAACSNPFGNDEITGEKRTLTGAVTISGAADLSGVYVWLDRINVGVFTDEKGEFKLTLPPKSTLNASGEVSGEFDLYFYSINCKLEIRKVLLRNGVLLYGEADVDKNGAVRNLTLIQTFSVETRSAFPQISPGDPPEISITAHMRACIDSFAVNIPGGNFVLLGGVFIKRIETGQVFMFELAGTEGRPYIEMLDKKERLWSFHPDVFDRGLEMGTYRIYPLVYPNYPDIPAGLFETLGLSPQVMDEKYLDLFVLGTFAEFEVLEDLQP